MKTSISAFAALMIASSFAGSALADGDYFEGATKTQASAQVDHVNTGSVDQVRTASQRDDQQIFGKTSRDNR